MEFSPKDKAADDRLRKLYGKSLAWYNEQLARQGGGCAICQRKPGRLRLAVDHNHRTSIVRGLLCMTCNRKVLGVIEKFRICPQWVIDYLKAFDKDNPLIHGRGWQTDLGHPARKKAQRCIVTRRRI